MLPVEAWAVYYADTSSFTSKDGTWAQAPPFGVQCVVYYHVEDRGRLVRTVDAGREVYTFQGEAAGDVYKMGLWLDDDGFYRVVDLASRSVAP